MNRNTYWFIMDILAIFLGIIILFLGTFKTADLTQTENYIDYLVIVLMSIAVGLGVYCVYTRRNKILASLGVFAGIIGLTLSLILII